EHDAAFPAAPLETRVHLERADVTLALDAELFGPGGWNASAALDFARRRRAAGGPGRLYAVETMPTLTGSMADHRLALGPGALVEFSNKLAPAIRSAPPPGERWLAAAVRDLQQHGKRSLVVAGE